MPNIRFKYTKNHKYKCTRCESEYDELPIVCTECVKALGVPDKSGKLSQEYYDLFSPEDRGY